MSESYINGVIRNGRRDCFLVVERLTVHDSRLSYKARGLLAALLAYPPDWKISVKQLAGATPLEGRDSIYSGLKELESLGYLVRHCYNDPKTGYRTWIRTIYESPVEVDPTTGQVSSLRPHPAKPEMVHQPDTDEPDTANPDAYKVNKDKTVSDKTKKERAGARAKKQPTSPPPERARSQKKDQPRSEPEPEAIEHQPPQPEPNPSSLVAKETTPAGPNFPPPAAENLQKIVPIRAGNSAANFEARWNRSKHPWILPDGKIHPAMVASYALSYPGVSRLPNGQINEPMITCVINRKTRSEADLPEMVALWEQAQRGGESDPQYGAIASRLPRTRQQIQDDRQAKTDAAWAAIEADYQQRQRAAL